MMEHLCCFYGEAWSAYDDSSGESVSIKNIFHRVAMVDNELTTVTICHLHSRVFFFVFLSNGRHLKFIYYYSETQRSFYDSLSTDI
jgi:hypothetical protein